MPRRNSTSGAFRVGGSDRRYPTLGAAINVASRRAEQADDEVRIGVYEQDTQRYRVVRRPDRTVVILEVSA